MMLMDLGYIILIVWLNIMNFKETNNTVWVEISILSFISPTHDIYCCMYQCICIVKVSNIVTKKIPK